MPTDVLGFSSARHPFHNFLPVRFPSSAFQNAASIASSESSETSTASNFDDGVTKHDAEVPAGSGVTKHDAEVPAGSTWIASSRDTLAAGARWDDDKGGESSYTFASASQSTLAPSAARPAAAAVALPPPGGHSHVSPLLLSPLLIALQLAPMLLSPMLSAPLLMAPLLVSLSILPGGAVPKLSKSHQFPRHFGIFPVFSGMFSVVWFLSLVSGTYILE